MGNNNFDSSVSIAIVKNGAKDLFCDLTDITLNVVSNSDIIEQIPVVGIIKKGLNIVGSVTDYLFYNKLIKFLYHTDTFSEKEKAKMVRRIQKDKKYKNKVGARLIEIIDKADDEKKIYIIAQLFCAFAEEKIDIEKFFKFSQIVNNSFLPDLESLIEYFVGKIDSIDRCSSLLGLGVIEVKYRSFGPYAEALGGLADESSIYYEINSLGEELCEIIK